MKAKVGMDLGGGEKWGRMGKGGGAVRFQCLRRCWKINDLCRLCKRNVQGQGAGGASPLAPRPPPLAINALWCAGWRAGE